MKRITKARIWRILIVLFLFLNIGAFAGAYGMTHVVPIGEPGFGKPKPYSTALPSNAGLSYTTHRISINSEEWLEAWSIPAPASPKGTVLLFHGNGGSKAGQLLSPAQRFHLLGYDTWLVDFRGAGASSGKTTTLGIREAEDVALSLAYAQETALNPPFILYGISMGSVAVLRAAVDGDVQNTIQADALIVELPFATLLSAVRSRVAAARFPTFPLSELIVFWGSVQHRFNGFAHNPVDYASQVTTDTLVLHGEQDRWTTMAEINQIVENLKGDKQLVTFPTAGHDMLVSVDEAKWMRAVEVLLNKVS